MQTIPYKVAISGDNEQLKKVIADSQGRLERIDDEHILVSIDYDGNYDEFYKIIQKIYKSCPEIGINFQYHMNKKALEQELSTLQDYELSIKDPKAAYDRLLKETNAFIEKYNNSVAKRKQFDFVNNGLDEDSEKYDTLNSKKFEQDRKRILSIYNTFLKLDKKGEYAKNFSPIIDNLVGSFQELDVGFEGVIQDIVGSQKERVDEIQANIDNIVKKAKEMGIELESTLGGGGGSGPGGGGGGGDKTIHVYMDTTNFDEGVAHVKSELDNLPDEKQIKISIGNTETNKFDEMIRGWAEAMEDNGVFANEHYAAYDSRTNQLAGGYTEGQVDTVKSSQYEKLFSRVKADTYVHSHPEKYAAFSDADIEVSLRDYAEGITKQLVVAQKEIMELNFDALDISNFTEFVNSGELRREKDEIMSQINQFFLEQFMRSSDLSTQIAQEYLEKSGLKNVDVSAYEKIGNKVRSSLQNEAYIEGKSTLQDFVDNLIDNVRIHTDDYISHLSMEEVIANPDLLDGLNEFRENATDIYDVYLTKVRDQLQLQWQDNLLDIFSSPILLKDGYTSAIKVESIDDYLKNSASKVEDTNVPIKLSISNIDTLRSEIDSKLNSDTFSIFVYPELSATGVENFKQEVDELLKKRSIDIAPNVSAETKEVLSSNITTNEVSTVPKTDISPKANLDITDFKLNYESAMDMVDKLNQSSAIVNIYGNATDFTNTARVVDRMVEALNVQKANIDIGSSDVKDTLKGLEQVKDLQQKLDATPIKVPIQLGSVTEFKKQLKEFGKTQTVDVGVTPKITSEGIKTLKEEAEAKLGKNSKSKGIPVNIKPVIDTKDVTELKKTLQESLEKIPLKDVPVGVALNNVEALSNQIKEAVLKVSPIPVELKPTLSSAGVKDIAAQIAKEFNFEAVSNKPADGYTSTKSELILPNEVVTQEEQKKDKAKKDNTELARYKKQASEITTIYEKLEKAVAKGNTIQLFNREVQDLKDEIDKLNQNPIKVVGEDEIECLNQLEEKVKKVADKLPNSKKGSTTRLATLREQVTSAMSKYSGMGSGQKAAYAEVLGRIEKAYKSDNTTTGDVEELVLTVKKLKAELNQSGRSGGFLDLTAERLKGINAQFIAQYFSIQDFIRYIQAAATEVIKLDTALTELHKVSNASTETLNKSFQRSAATAKELGATISDVINMTADWSKLGYSVEDSETLARATTLFKNVGDNMTADEASSYMISTMQGFQIEAEDAISVIDKYNEVANNFAISTEGIGQALQRSAAAFNSANTDLSEAIALVTTANTIAQDPESVGNAFKILSARIRGASNELKELGEDETEVVSTSSMRNYVKGITGVDILEEDGKTFKSLYDILLGISKVWNDLTDLEQQGLVEKLAGKNRSNILLALLQNGEDLEKAYSTAINSSGSAMKEQANYSQSIQYSIDKTKASLQELASTTLKTDDIKNAVELFNSLVQAANNLVSVCGVLVPLVTTLGTAFAFKNASSNGKFFTGVSEALTGLQYFKQGKNLKSRQGQLQGQISNLESKIELRQTKGTIQERAELPDLENELADAKNELKEIETQTKPLDTALSALKGTVITLGFEAAAATVYSFATAESRLQSAAYEASQALEEQDKAFDEYTSQIEAQYAILQDSNSTYDQQLEARQALYDLQGQLISTYGEEANKVNLLTDNYNDLSSVLERVGKLKESQLTKVWDEYSNLNSSNGFIEKLTNGLLNFFSGVDNNAERAMQHYKNYSLDSSIMASGISDEEKEYNRRVKEILAQNNVATKVNATNSKTTYVGNAEDVKTTLEEIQQVANKFNLSNVVGQLSSAYAKVSSTVSQYQDFINAMTYVQEFQNNSSQREVLEGYEDIAARYEQATVAGDAKALEALQSEVLAYVNSDAYTNLSDEAIRYIEALYPQLQAQIESWRFKITFESDTDNIKKYASAFSNSEELRNALEGNLSDSEMTGEKKEAVKYFQSQGYDTDALVGQIEANDILPTKTTQDFEARCNSLKMVTAGLRRNFEKLTEEQKKIFLDATKEGEDATKAWKAYAEVAKGAKNALSAGEMMTKLTALDDGFKDLQTIFNDVKDGKDFDFSGLVDAAANLSIEGETEAQFNALKDAIATSPDDVAKCQSAFNDLVAAFIQAKVETKDLTAENESAIASYLKAQGVTNATAVAHQLVAQALAEEAYQAALASNGNDELKATMSVCAEAANLEEQGLESDARAYVAYAMDKMSANIVLYTNEQIAQLAAEAEKLGYAASAWRMYYTAKSGAEKAANAKIGDWVGDKSEEGGYRISSQEELEQYQAQAQESLNQIAKEFKESAEQQQQDIKNNATYTAPPSKSGGSGGGGSGSGNKGQTIDQSWDERAVKQAERAYEKYVDILEDDTKSYSERVAVYEEANRDQWKQSYEAFANYAKQYREAINGNLDITEYTPTWSEEDNRYKTDLGETAGIVSNGSKTFTVQIATKLADGTELTPEQAQEYLKSLSTNSSDDLLKSDTKKILIRFVEGNDPNAFIYEQGQDQIKNLQYLRDLSYGTYKEQKDQIDSLTESLDAYLEALKAQIGLYEKAAENDKAEVKKQFGEDKGNELIELAKNGSLDADNFRTYITGATDEQKQALENLIEDFEQLDSLQDDYEDKQKLNHEYRMKRYELELEKLEALQGVYEAYQSIYESQISLKEATGKLVTTGDYIKLLDNSEKITDSYEKQLSVLREQLEETKPLSSEYYEVQSKILNIEDSLIQVKEQQAEWNEEIKNIPINLLDQYLERLKAIQNLVSDYMSLQTTYGKANTADEYKEIFKIANDNIDYALEQQKKLKEKLANYEWGSDKYNETASSIESINDDISSIIEQMVEWNQAILNIPLDKLNEVNEQLNLVITAMSDIESEYDQVISAVTDSIDKQMEDLEDQQEAYDDNVQDRIDKIQELIDALEKENEAREKLLDVSEAEYDLEKARTQQSIATIKKGSITYVADEESEREAQQALEQAQYDYKIYQLQQQIEQLEKEKEDKDEQYQDEIDNLQKIADKWSEITSNIDLAKNQLKALEYLGDGWLNKVLTGDDAEIYQQFKTLYETMDKDLTQYQEQVASNERIATLMEQFITQYENGSITYTQALNGLNSLVSSLKEGLDVNGTLTSYKELFAGSGMSSVSDILTKLQNSAQTEANNLANYMSIYKSNEEVISKYTSTWEELKKSVDEQIKALKEAYEAALAAAAAMSYYSSSGGSGGGGGGSEYTTNITIAGRNYEVNSSTGAVTYFNGKSAGYSVSVSGGRYTGSSSSSSSGSSHVIGPSGNYIRHDGIERGAIASTTDDEKANIIRKMALKPIKTDEIPQLLKRGEVVLNESQQAQLVKNMGLLGRLPSSANVGTNVVLNMSNLTFNEVNDGQDFANFITKNLSNAVSQAMAK